MSQEITAQLLMGPAGREYHGEFTVKFGKHDSILDIYTYRDHYDNMPPILQALTWKQKHNPLFIHVTKTGRDEAWEYLKKYAILDEEMTSP